MGKLLFIFTQSPPKRRRKKAMISPAPPLSSPPPSLSLLLRNGISSRTLNVLSKPLLSSPPSVSVRYGDPRRHFGARQPSPASTSPTQPSPPRPMQPEMDYSAVSSYAVPRAQPSSRVFVGYSIYKGKAALTVEPRAPEFAPLNSGAYKVSKEGFILLQFAPAVGARQYDWNRKQVFSLSIAEIGQLMSLGAKDSCEFFHDPFKGRSEEGKVRKVLKAEPLPDGSGHFFNLSVQNRVVNVDESIYIPISRAEFAILNSSFNFIVPHLLGWHAFAMGIKPEDSLRANNALSNADLEWGR